MRYVRKFDKNLVTLGYTVIAESKAVIFQDMQKDLAQKHQTFC